MSLATTGVPAAKPSVSTMPKLSPPSDGATSRSALASAACLRSSETLPRARTPRGSSMSGATSSSPAPMTSSSTGTCSRSASKARSRTGRPLRSTAPPENALGGRAGERGGRRAAVGWRLDGHDVRHVDAVGDPPVAAAVEAPAGPGGGLGDGDADAQGLELAAHAERAIGDAVGDRVLRVAVERADARRDREVEGVVADGRRGRLVDVD